MRIVILGAGQVGATLAEKLSSEANDITVIDTEPKRLRELQDRLDIRTLEGAASHPGVLEQAGCADCDMLIAVTNSDEVNMIACQVASTLFNTPRKIARIRSPSYLQYARRLFVQAAVPVDVLISPEQLVTAHIEQLLHHPGALQVLDFADGVVRLVALRVDAHALMCGKPVAEFAGRVPGVDMHIVALYRRGAPVLVHGDTRIDAGDEVFVIAAREQVARVMALFTGHQRPYRQVMIAGGGNIGLALAARLDVSFNVKVLERRIERCNQIASELKQAVVIHGCASEQGLLAEEGIERVDLFCALTNDDEANVMSSMLAKRLGARAVMTLINNPAYVDLVEGGVIDNAISPQQITIGNLLTYVRRGDVVRVYSLRHGAAEALEAVAHGDSRNSRVVGRRVGELRLPLDVSLGAIVREGRMLLALRERRIENGDHLIFFLTNKQSLRAVENLFQVGFSFF